MPAHAQAGAADGAVGDARPSSRRRLWRRLRQRPALAHAAGIALFGLALLSRFALRDVLPPGYPFLTFFPAILFSTFLGGRGPGTVCALLSILASWYWFVPPVDSFGLDFASLLAVLFFTAISAVDVLVIDAVVRKQEALEAEQAKIAALLAQRSTLFSELQHRVSNNMAMVSAVLASQQRRLAHNPEAVEALREARARFQVVSNVHRQLHDPALKAEDFCTALAEMCRESLRAADRPIALDTDLQPVSLSLETRTSVSVLVVELLTNAMKHAFDGVGAPRLSVSLQPRADGGYELSVADNGGGLPEGFDPMKSDRLGLRIVQSLVQGLRGRWTTRTGPDGTRFTITVAGADDAR